MWAPVAFFDAPNQVLDCTQTAIPKSSDPPLQVVASLAKDANRVLINDALGKYAGLYVGAVGQEQLLLVIAGGSSFQMPVSLTQGARISIRSMSNVVIDEGSVCVTFIG
jgi:hypothetical protein